MTKMICYDEFCGPKDRFHLWSIVLAALVILTSVSAVVIVGTFLTGLEPVMIPWNPTDF